MGGGSRWWVRGPVLGRGSTATVHLAAATPTKARPAHLFAVKSAELSRSAPLQREQSILSSLRSPHVVSYLGAEVAAHPDGRVLYHLFLEYVPGGTLADLVRRHPGGRLDEGPLRALTRGVLAGLAYLHSMGIAHCDVKTQNVLLGAGDVVKLADLGCARWVGTGSGSGSGGGVVGGTPLYMAPEVARGEEQGTAADVWGLGCAVVEMATGCPPWPGVADPVAALHRVAFSGAVPEFPPGVSGDGRDFLGRCLRRDPAERWSAEQLLRHPFVRCADQPAAACRLPDSPTSTLELQGLLDSWELDDEQEEETESRVADSSPVTHLERVRQLTSDGGAPPPLVASSTLEESSWITVRSGVGEDGGDGPPTVRSDLTVTTMTMTDNGDNEDQCGGCDHSLVTKDAHLPANSSQSLVSSSGGGGDSDDPCMTCLFSIMSLLIMSLHMVHHFMALMILIDENFK